MKRSRTIFALLALASLVLQGTACDGSSPFAPDDTPGGPDLPGPGSSFHQSGATIESASRSSAGPTRMTIILDGNVQIRVTDGTVIDAGGDLTTVDQVLAALDAGIPIRIEVDGTLLDGVVNATHIRFETDGSSSSGGNDTGSGGDDGIAQDDEVHGLVAAVDLGARTVTLADGRALRIGNDAQIEAEGDFRTLADVAAALAAGLEVRVEADLAPATGGVLEATSAKFESDEAVGPGDDDGDDNSGPGSGGGDDNSGPGNDGDDNSSPGNGGDDNSGPGNGGGDDDFGDDEVEGIVAAVNLAARTVTTTSGRVIGVATDALIEAEGDILTLAGVAERLAAGATIRVEANGVAEGGVFVATQAKFEVD
jgi:hypothetical protein